LAQICNLHKGLIKYYKFNVIIPMNIHFQIAHLKLFAYEKKLNKKVVELVAHVQQIGKKGMSSFGYGIIIFFDATKPLK